MPAQPTTPLPAACVAILNTSSEVIEILQMVIEDEGFSAATGFTLDFKRGKQDLEAFFQMHQPSAVIYDIAIPYEENWEFLQQRVIRASGLDRSSFIITTTNKEVLQRLIGPIEALEIVGKPFDLDELVTIVRRIVLEPMSK